jgi:hypothetical protein
MSVTQSERDTMIQAVMGELVPILERGIGSTVAAAVDRAPTWAVVPGKIHATNGPVAEVEPDDTPGETIEAIRLDDFQGVSGGVIGSRVRTLLLRIPPSGIYCLGAIPEDRPEVDATNPSFFRSVSDDIPRGAGVLTDMTTTADLTGGYLYSVHAHGEVGFGTANVPYRGELDQDGTIIGSFWRFADPDIAGASSNEGFDSQVRFVAAEDIEGSVFTVGFGAGSGGIQQLLGSAGAPRTLSVTCLGPARGVAAP